MTNESAKKFSTEMRARLARMVLDHSGSFLAPGGDLVGGGQDQLHGGDAAAMDKKVEGDRSAGIC